MLYSVDHSVGVARDLADRLSLRFTNNSGLNSIQQTQDENGFPILVISSGGNQAAGQPVVWIRLMNMNVGSVDIFGNSTLPFTPTVGQIAYEINTAGTGPTPSVTDFSTCLLELGKTGVVIQEYAIAHGTQVNEAAVNAASPSLTIKDIDWGLKGNT